MGNNSSSMAKKAISSTRLNPKSSIPEPAFSSTTKSSSRRLISILELESLMRFLCNDTTVDEVELITSTMDLDGDGLISFEELTGVSKKSTDSTCCTDDLWNAFMVFDRDKNGLILAEELHCLRTVMGEKTTLADCKAMIKGVDLNGDGAIDFQEFKHMMLTRNIP